MNTHCTLLGLAFSLVSPLALLHAGVVSATAQRTFVASNGNDAAPCSISQPCRSFAAAVANTNAGGEVIVLDSAGYGKVTVTKPVSIIAPPGIYAGISVFAGDDGITVNAGANDKVTLRGLTINGQGGNDGIVYASAAALEIDRCIVTGMSLGGIEVLAAGRTTIADSIFERNAIGIAFDNLSPGSGKALLTSVRVNNNNTTGLFVGVGQQVQVRGSVFDGNGTAGVDVQADANGAVTTLDLAGSHVSANGNFGIALEIIGSVGTFVQALLSDNVITDHTTAGIQAFTQIGAAGGVHAVLTRNAVRGYGTAAGIDARNPHTELLLEDNDVSQTSIGVNVVNSAIVRSRGDNMVDDNTMNQSGAVSAVNTL